MSRLSVVSVANEKVPITTACRLCGVPTPDLSLGRSTKLRCPFGEVYHSDGGVEAAMRVYPDTNHAYCFRCQAAYRPVQMYALANGLSYRDAAVDLLDHIGYKPATLADLWANAVRREIPPDTTLLAEALKTYCRRVCPDWDDRQYTGDTAAALTRCLSLLERVSSDQEAHDWLNGCKAFMDRVLV